MELRNDSGTRTAALSGFLQAIRSSSILSGPQLERVEAEAAEAGDAAEPSEFAARLVKEGLLTEFQAKQILKGKTQGLVFGRYVILDVLGRGAMARVYKAWHRMMGRVVAIKILDAKYVANPRSLARFHREMQLVGRLDHPNVVRAFDADRVGENYFIAMEYSPGQSLGDLLQEKGALPPADVVFFAAQAADGLAHAHAQGVLHRDIKPSNMLLTDARKLKILDFGLGKLQEKEDLPASLTAAGITVGTPDYISPEQARMVEVDGRSDLYSLGCSMYHLITGRLPFKGESSMDCIVGRITGKATPLAEVRPGLPPRLVQTIEKLMATNPDDRYQTAEEAAAALRSLLKPRGAGAGAAPARPAGAVASAAPATAAGPPPTSTAPKKAPPPEEPASLSARAGAQPAIMRRATARPSKAEAAAKSRQRLVAAGAAAGVLLLIVGAFVLFRPTKPEAPIAQGSNEESQETAPVKTEAPAARQAAPSPDTRTAAVAPVAKPAPARARMVIESPRDGATVNMREELTVRVEADGWPVIFVQAMIPGQPWWCQAAVTKVENGRFTTEVVFGDERTKSGTKYRIVGLLARSSEEASRFELGAQEQALPQELPRSAEVVVTHK
jgi:serine/threonine-protein kinase